ncbi:MAG: EthD domain-containing protein [bacterium]
MYCVRISYPRKSGSTFNFSHYYDVHSPLGLEMVMKYGGIQPVKILVDELDVDNTQDSAAGYHCICSIYFEEKAGAEAMLGMFAHEEPQRRLSEDFPNYTETEPEVTLIKVTELDPATGKELKN